jgi:Uma2 family endonuclease
VICDLEKIEKKGCVGAPDLIVEILSPGNSRKEVIDKYEIYQEAGVKEYWVIYPAEQVLQVYSLENAIFVAKKPNAPGDIYESHLFPELQINVEAIFEGAEGLI